MSNTTKSTTQTSPEHATTAVLVHINPAEAVVGENVRLDARLDKAFIASVRERGVLVPVVGHWDTEGRFVVLYGQRRTLAAVEAKRDTIPAYVVAAQQDADRLIDQMAENDHRAALTAAERAKGFEQLAALGLTAAQIAKRTATKRSDVDAGLAVAGSELATKAADRWDFLTLEQAAGLAEFEGDADAVKELTVAAQRGGFDHALQRLRDKREERAQIDAYAQELTTAGITVVEPIRWDTKTTKRLDDLRTPEGGEIPADEHAHCPGHAAYVVREWEWDQSDDTDDGDGDESDEDAGQYVTQAVYVCTDYQAHGHRYRWDSGTSGSKPKAADLTEEEREAAKAERRDVIESNKAWDSAEKVRREWVKTFLTRKTAPRGTVTLIGQTIAQDANRLTDLSGNRLAADWFGVESASYGANRGLVALVEKATEPRAQVIALGMVLAGYEAATGRHSWRNVENGTARYLTFLAANGYDLADVEKRAAGIKTRAARASTTSK